MEEYYANAEGEQCERPMPISRLIRMQCLLRIPQRDCGCEQALDQRPQALDFAWMHCNQTEEIPQNRMLVKLGSHCDIILKQELLRDRIAILVVRRRQVEVEHVEHLRDEQRDCIRRESFQQAHQSVTISEC